MQWLTLVFSPCSFFALNPKKPTNYAHISGGEFSQQVTLLFLSLQLLAGNVNKSCSYLILVWVNHFVQCEFWITGHFFCWGNYDRWQLLLLDEFSPVTTSNAWDPPAKNGKIYHLGVQNTTLKAKQMLIPFGKKKEFWKSIHKKKLQPVSSLAQKLAKILLFRALPKKKNSLCEILKQFQNLRTSFSNIQWVSIRYVHFMPSTS